MKAVLLVLGTSVILLSCATPAQKGPTPVKPAQSFEGPYINVKAPGSDGWLLLGSSPRGMAFAKRGLAAGESFGAVVRMFDLPAINTESDLVEAVKAGLGADADPARFEVIESSFQQTSSRAYPCVRYHGLFNDKQAQTSSTTTEPLLLEMYALYCRHPVRTSSGFSANYSYRGRSRYPSLESESQSYIDGIQVPPPNP